MPPDLSYAIPCTSVKFASVARLVFPEAAVAPPPSIWGSVTIIDGKVLDERRHVAAQFGALNLVVRSVILGGGVVGQLHHEKPRMVASVFEILVQTGHGWSPIQQTLDAVQLLVRGRQRPNCPNEFPCATA